jgi:hypothetical protein
VQRFNPDSLQFLGKMLERSGLGNDTYTPPWLVNEPICMDIAHARLEFEITCFGAVQELLNKTGACRFLCCISCSFHVLLLMFLIFLWLFTSNLMVSPWLVNEPICMDIAHAGLEFEITCFGAVQELINQTGAHGFVCCISCSYHILVLFLVMFFGCLWLALWFHPGCSTSRSAWSVRSPASGPCRSCSTRQVGAALSAVYAAHFTFFCCL